MSCENHKKEVAGISDMMVLAEMIGDLHYESLSKLMLELSGKFLRDSGKDFKDEKLLLAAQLAGAHNCLHQCYFNIYNAWQISKPFMEPQ